MIPFDPSTYPAPIAELWSNDRLPELGPGTPNVTASDALNSLSIESVFPNGRDRDAAQACLSGLWLYHDFLDVSHTISQDIESWIGSYWHGIMHRREPDPHNAKYWFRRVAATPVFDLLGAQAQSLHLKPGVWDPIGFVDACERERGTGSAMELRCRQVQRLEMQLLFQACYKMAMSS